MATTWTPVDSRRVGAVLLGAGVLLVVGNALHPFLDTVGDAAALVEEVAPNPGWWATIHLVIGVGLVVLAVGIVGLARSLRGLPGEGWGRAGAITGVVGSGIFATQIMAIDAVATILLVERIEEEGAGAAMTALEAVVAVDLGILSVSILVLIGLANLFLGAGLVLARTLPPWVGWVMLSGGALGTVTGVILVVGGPSTFGINVLFRIAAAVVTIGVLAAGWILYRQGRAAILMAAEEAARP